MINSWSAEGDTIVRISSIVCVCVCADVACYAR